MLWNESAALLTDSMAMQGRQFINDTLGESPALRLTGEEVQDDGLSAWDEDRDEMSMDMLTDVDEEEMDEEKVKERIAESKKRKRVNIKA